MIDKLPRRERELFEILCSVREASAAEIRGRLADPPSYSAVRTMLSRLEARGLISHRADDQTYIYSTVSQPAKVRRSALNKFIETFFEGSPASAATALLGMSKKLTADEVDALQRAIDAAKERK